MAEVTRSWWARATLIGSVVALVLLLVGPLGTRFGIWGFQTGLLVLIPGGVLLAAIGLLIGLVSLFVSKKRGFTGDTPILLTSIALCMVILVGMGSQFQKGASVPPIHNISTDQNDPPQFTAAIIDARGPDSNPLEYDSEDIGPKQTEAYPGVRTRTLAKPRDAVFADVIRALKEMNLEIQSQDQAAGVVEATATTFWFGFKDDLVVRLRESDGQTLVDVRSVSRVGMSDLGANAARIQDLLGRL